MKSEEVRVKRERRRGEKTGGVLKNPENAHHPTMLRKLLQIIKDILGQLLNIVLIGVGT